MTDTLINAELDVEAPVLTRPTLVAPPQLREGAAPPDSAVKRVGRVLALATIAVDMTVVAVAYALSWMIRGQAGLEVRGARTLTGRAAVLTVPVWIVVFLAYGLYNRRELTAGSEEARRIVRATAVSVVAVVVITFFMRISVPRGWVLSVAVLGLGLVGLGRACVRSVIRRLTDRGMLATAALIVGTNEEARTIARSLSRNHWLSYGVIGFVSTEPGTPASTSLDGPPVVGSIDRLADLVRETQAGAVIIAGTAVGCDSLRDIDQALQPLRVEVRLSPGLPHVSPSRITVRPLDGLALLSLDRRELGRWEATIKRTFDLIAGSLLLLAALPLMVVLGIIVKLPSEGPALFSQDRVGQDGRLFRIFKLRTMTVDAELRLGEIALANGAEGLLFKMREDPRVTRTGAVLRKWGLDELPQLLNVVRGDMSLVGPRPALPQETVQYSDRLRGRLRVKPGLTGLWQVNGRHTLSFDDYIRYDLFYVENWSLALDLYVIAKTVPALLSRRGAY